MINNSSIERIGLGVALMIIIFVSPFDSSDPDGLDRVSQDLEFNNKASENILAEKLPFHSIFEKYALRGFPKTVATPLPGLIGTLATFGIAWGAGKILINRKEGF
ncbi:PDGLE domain-containing protein [cyanobacterium endosymbiont of Rhopalodia gibberula]|uniref:PDGLE domain-containing protein n=1 Tax=cyanobacterium endosymbiont of Rhopalodia gibberula TaxID=1763363 RepID=UPI000E651A74|nr:PDGLE domain-containing protein [cyanobacterium endosymbiont of Rhopalodia gibberula]